MIILCNDELRSSQLQLIGLLLLLINICTAPGCKITRGPAIVRNSHVDYNEAFAEVTNEELLLNIVRRRYLESPRFVRLASISTQISNAGSLGASGNITEGATPNVLGLNGNLQASDTPTITVTPLQGPDIAKRLHEPIPPSVVSNLSGAGYGFHLLIALLVDNLNGVNGPRNTIGSSFRGGSPEYVELIHLAQLLQEQGSMQVGDFRFRDPYSDVAFEADEITPQHLVSAVPANARFQSFDGKKYYHMFVGQSPGLWIDEEARYTTEGARFLQLVNLDPAPLRRIWGLSTSYVIRGPDQKNQPNEPRELLRMKTRTFYGVLNFLAFGVQVPLCDQNGQTFTLEEFRAAVDAGLAFDITEGFQIRCSDCEPDCAAVSVYYRGKWFYIDDRDRSSKRIFNALLDIYELQVAPSGGATAPVLTLPLG